MPNVVLFVKIYYFIALCTGRFPIMTAALARNADHMAGEGVCSSIGLPFIHQRQINDQSEGEHRYCAVGSACGQRPIYWERESSTNAQTSRMPGTTGPLLASLPSFMSVFGNVVDVQEARELDNTTSIAANRTANTLKRPGKR